MATLGAMQFGAWKLGLEHLQGLLQSPPVAAWKNADWHQTFKKEAIPLPLDILDALENAIVAHSEDELFLCGLMLMCWGGLKWCDLQRIELSSVSCQSGVLRGLCWRTKSSLSQFPASSSLSQFAAPSSLSQVPCPQFAAPSSLPPSSLSPVPCPKFPSRFAAPTT